MKYECVTPENVINARGNGGKSEHQTDFTSVLLANLILNIVGKNSLNIVRY